jgi:hypothetical protein
MEKVTDPVGVPVDGLVGATSAVKLTACPVTEGSLEDVTVVVVGPAWTALVRVPTLPANIGSSVGSPE